MGRAVAPKIKGQGADAQAGSGESYAERLVKYFPIETSGPYVAASGLITGVTVAGSDRQRYWLLATFAVLLGATVWILFKRYPRSTYRHPTGPIAMGVGAYVIWCYTLNALPQGFGVYDPLVAGVVPILYSPFALMTPAAAEAKPVRPPPAPVNGGEAAPPAANGEQGGAK